MSRYSDRRSFRRSHLSSTTFRLCQDHPTTATFVVPDVEDTVVDILATEGLSTTQTDSHHANAGFGVNHRISEYSSLGFDLMGGYRTFDSDTSDDSGPPGRCATRVCASGRSEESGNRRRIGSSYQLTPIARPGTADNGAESRRDLRLHALPEGRFAERVRRCGLLPGRITGLPGDAGGQRLLLRRPHVIDAAGSDLSAAVLPIAWIRPHATHRLRESRASPRASVREWT